MWRTYLFASKQGGYVTITAVNTWQNFPLVISYKEYGFYIGAPENYRAAVTPAVSGLTKTTFNAAVARFGEYNNTSIIRWLSVGY